MNNPNVKKGLDFEKKCVDKLKELDFENVSLTKYTDYGADIVATGGHIKYIFQCKNVKNKQGVKAVQEILTAKHFYSAQRCGVISESEFTPQAYKLAHPNYCYLITSKNFFNLQNKNSLVSDSIDKLSQVGYDYDIIKSYESLKQTLGKIPTWRELDKSLRYHIKKKYGNYSLFITKIGERFSKSRPTEEQLKNEYKRIRTIVGKIPSGENIRQHSVLPYNSFHSYPITRIQQECGDAPNLKKGVPKEILIAEYFDLAKKIGRYPNREDLNKRGKYRYSYYAHLWKNLGNFLKEVNVSVSDVQIRKYSKDETVLMFSLIEVLMRLKENNSKKVINSTVLKNLKYNDKTLFDKGIIANKFGSFDNFFKILETDKKYSDIRQNLQKLLTELLKK
jgi:hypothetical protein